MNPELIKVKINQAILTKNDEQLEQYAKILKSSIIKSDNFFQQYFDVLFEILTQENLLNLKSAWNFFFALKNCRDLLSKEQKKICATSLETIYRIFDDINLDKVINNIESIIAKENGKELELAASDIEDSFFGMDHYPSDLFNFLISKMNESSFLNFEYTSQLLSTFRYNFELLSDSQKEILVETIKINFNKFKDFVSQVALIYFLGHYLANENALNAICYLKKIADDNSRSYVPHGFEFLIYKLTDENLLRKAKDELLEMQNDPLENVRYEANRSLQKLVIQGYIIEGYEPI